MIARQITIHVGLPKTATTTIQRHLFRNSQHLLDLGIDYCPDLCGLGKYPKAPAHHAIARAYMIPKGSSLPPESRDVIQRRLSGPGGERSIHGDLGLRSPEFHLALVKVVEPEGDERNEYGGTRPGRYRRQPILRRF